mmetsp:Transcript_18519/g.30321  ORF Transcript_18519/g.30321 Transcript_18519/m.30321 type:complete len:219 (+) Transcript_18519:4572-5228(+)
MRRNRTEVNDRSRRTSAVAPLGLLDHAPRDLLAEAQRRHEILLQQMLDRGVFGVQRVGFHHLARGVDQNIDLIKGIDGGRHQIGNGQPLAQIARKIANVALIGDVSQLFGKPLFVHIGAHYIGAPVRKGARNSKANAVGRPRHNGRLARDRKCHLLSSCPRRPLSPHQFEARIAVQINHFGKMARQRILIRQMPICHHPERPMGLQNARRSGDKGAAQ